MRLLRRGVYLAPMLTATGLRLAVAIDGHGRRVAEEGYRPDEWPEVCERLWAALEQANLRLLTLV